MIAQSWESGSSPVPRANDNTVVQGLVRKGPHAYFMYAYGGDYQ